MIDIEEQLFQMNGGLERRAGQKRKKTKGPKKNKPGNSKSYKEISKRRN